MRVLFILSLYSGIRNSIIHNVWNPTGMPAVYKLFEGMKDGDVPFDVIFFDKNHSRKYFFVFTKHFSDRFPTSKFVIVQPPFWFVKIPVLIRDIVRGLVIGIYVFCSIEFRVYGSFYFDRSNIITSLFIARRSYTTFHLRLHGIGKKFELYSNVKLNLRVIIEKFSMQNYFCSVIVTTDGTPGRMFIEKYAPKIGQAYYILNGVSPPEICPFIGVREKLRVCFLSRLETDKGVDILIEIINMYAAKPCYFEFWIIGDGSYADEIQLLAGQHANVVYFGALGNDAIFDILSEVDVLLSFNYLGNLSNAVLEAVAMFVPVITFQSDYISGRDVQTPEVLGSAAMYLPMKNVLSALREVFDDYDELNRWLCLARMAIKEEVTGKLYSWERRISWEIDLIRPKLCES